MKTVFWNILEILNGFFFPSLNLKLGIIIHWCVLTSILILVVISIYPTPASLARCDTRLIFFFSKVKPIWTQSFHSSTLVAFPRWEGLICLIAYSWRGKNWIHAFLKGKRMKWNGLHPGFELWLPNKFPMMIITKCTCNISPPHTHTNKVHTHILETHEYIWNFLSLAECQYISKKAKRFIIIIILN